MMKLICCLRDLRAEQFMQPFFVPTIGVASRNLEDEYDRGGEGNMLKAHPGDFDLYQLGSFDDETGYLHPADGPIRILNVASLVVPVA
jgi:hypothetical protein